jgi:hypothetical protein
MTYQEGVRLATRSIAIYLVVFAISDLLNIPYEVLTVARTVSVVHSHASVLNSGWDISNRGFLRMDLASLLENLLKTVLWTSLAIWFYRCGPHIQRYFSASESTGAEPPTQ